MDKKINNCLLAGIFLAAAFALAPFQSPAAQMEIVPGKFSGTVDSLTNYVCPDWFRDAKFGIWAHWGPQAVPMEGDWYARKMYQEGSPDYKDHLARYGHPSTNGWKDIIPLWKAEQWDPARLMKLYKKAGAKYFVSMGVHHDNFDLWNSPYHWWNAVNIGPQRDVVGEWQREAKKNGLPFGVSEHLGASFTWFQDSHKADKTGPFAGVPYDGANPIYDELYHPPTAPGDSKWYTVSGAAHQEWFNRINDLMARYQPDLLYSDGGLPFGEVGRTLVANFYNRSIAANGKLTAVYNCKALGSGEFRAGSYVQDVERGVMPGINPLPWQTDTSIGDWFYNKHWKYQPINWTVHMLVDIVSKNGNLLLNIVLRPDGTLDPEVETMLGQLSGWFEVNGEAIYGTRPWLVYGEGPARVKGGAFKEDFDFTAKDIRFTTKGKTLYAIALGWPAENKFTIRSLAKTGVAGHNEVKRVELLGHKGKLKFTQTADALIVELPAGTTNALTCALKITGSNFKPVIPPVTTVIIRPDAKGIVNLSALDAELHGTGIQLETQGGLPNIGFWESGDEWVSWRAQVPQAGVFKISANVAVADADASFVVEVGGQTMDGQAPVTGGWDQFQRIALGLIQIKEPGELVVKVRAKDAANWKPINLNSIRLTPAGVADEASVMPVSTPKPAEILTPPAPNTPRVNGPNIFGVRPGAQFLYTIPATGIRPMTFSADNLPAGLKLDSETGRITGVLEKVGEHKLTLRAKNSLGSAEKSFRIVVGENLALTPPMGWNSWNCWAGAVDQEKVLRSAQAMVASGLTQHGWTYINIDDTWQGRRGGPFNAILPNEKFPDMKALCDEIHALGLKAGIYSTPWVTSYGRHIGGSAENPEGAWPPKTNNAPRNQKILPYAVGKYSFATNDAAQIAAWGFDYLKYDWNPIERPQVVEMADALRATKRDILLSLSNNSRDRLLDRIADIAPLVQCWRTTGDINDSWGSLSGIGFTQEPWTQFAKPGHWNDPDMLVVGWVGWGPKLHATKLTPDEQYTHISLWCLLSAPLLIGCDLEKLDAFTLNLLSNDEVLAVDQDALGRQAVCVATEGDLRVYAKDLEDGSKAVGLFNLGNGEATVTAKWADLKISGKQTVRDLWRQKDLGEFSNEFTAKVPKHGVVLFRLIAAK
jgi:alpha-L-fucosidase